VTIAGLRSVDFARALDLAALSALVAEVQTEGRKTVLLAGGTDFMVEQEMRAPSADGAISPLVIDVSRMDELRGIALVPGGVGDVLRIGAATTYLEMRRSEVVQRRAPMIERMARDVGAVQIQARGTFGGNLATASPAADGVAALAAYDAVVVTHSVRGERRIAFADLQTGYKSSTRAEDEIIVAVELVLPREGSPWAWTKVGTRRAQSISKAALAAVAEVRADQIVRIGLGMASVGPTTNTLAKTRLYALSTSLGDIDPITLDKVIDSDIRPIDDIRSTARYRLHVAQAITRNFFETLGAFVR
jgi:xanthine dehydrogenase small subunit